jgi:hypothetical protein
MALVVVVALLVCGLCLLGCLVVLALCLKLYTEILKEKAIAGRAPAAALGEAVVERARAGWGPPERLSGGGS